jgi:hypothetical protein
MQPAKDPLIEARKRGRGAYAILAGFCLFWAVIELGTEHGGGSFAAYILSSIMAVIVRHTMKPGGVEDLLQMFVVKTRRKP